MRSENDQGEHDGMKQELKYEMKDGVPHRCRYSPLGLWTGRNERVEAIGTQGMERNGTSYSQDEISKGLVSLCCRGYVCDPHSAGSESGQ